MYLFRKTHAQLFGTINIMQTCFEDLGCIIFKFMLLQVCLSTLLLLFKICLQGNVASKDLQARPMELYMCSVLKRQGYGEGQFLTWSCIQRFSNTWPVLQSLLISQKPSVAEVSLFSCKGFVTVLNHICTMLQNFVIQLNCL